MLKIEDIQADTIGFEQAVYAVTLQIPIGFVLGYGHLARLIGKPGYARHVGRALRNLPADTHVPWWRVLRSNGTIALQGDIRRGPIQKEMLKTEGVSFRSEHTIDMAHRWFPEIL